MSDDARLATLAADAEAQLRAGNVEPAIAAHRALLALREDRPDTWYNLGWLLRAARRFDEALDAYAHALQHGVARPAEAHLNRAAILADHLFRPDDARRELRAALALDPDLVEAWLGLGNIAEDLGDGAAARDAYAAALRVAPGNGRASARLAALDVIAADPGAAIAQLRPALERAVTPLDRAEMLFALGNALNAGGDSADAFQAIEAANWIAGTIAEVRYDRAAQDRLVDRIIAAFPAPRPAAPVAPGPRPIFVCGMFRSGSTLVEQLLGRHPAICAGGELEFIPALVATGLTFYPERLPAPDGLAALARDYRAALPEPCQGARFVTDKRCDNILHVGLVKAMFPDAVIVHTRRQPLDNLLSLHMLHFGEGVTYSTDLGDAAHYYIAYRRIAAHWRALFADDMHDVDYDKLIRDPQGALEPVLAALGEPWDEACRAAVPSQAVRTASTWQVRQPLHARSSGRWRRYAAQLEGTRRALLAAGIDPDA